MKSLLIIPTYAPTYDKQQILKKAISCIREATDEFDIMLASHAPLPEDIINSVEYYVYDKDNRFSNGGGSIFWNGFANGTVLRFGKYSHEYPIVRLFRNSLGLAKANRYEFFYLTDFDNFYTKDDFQKIVSLRNQMFSENKKFIFFQPPEAVWTVEHVPLYDIFYDIFLSGGLVSEYFDIFDKYFPLTLEEYNERLGYIELGRPQCLEHFFFDAFKHVQNETLIIRDYVKNFVPNSEMNTSGLLSTVCMILPDESGKHHLYIANDNKEAYSFVVKINNLEKGTYNLYSSTIPGTLYKNSKVIELDEYCTVNVKVYINEIYLNEYNLEFREEYITEYKERGLIKFNP